MISLTGEDISDSRKSLFSMHKNASEAKGMSVSFTDGHYRLRKNVNTADTLSFGA